MTPNRGKPCTMAEFAALWNNHALTLAQIGDRLGISAQAVSVRSQSRGLPSRRHMCGLGGKHAAGDDPDFAAMFLAPVRIDHMAAHYGCAHATLYAAARRLGLSRPTTARRAVITLDEYRARQLAARMADTAAAERAQWALAEMVDAKTTAWKRRAA